MVARNRLQAFVTTTWTLSLTALIGCGESTAPTPLTAESARLHYECDQWEPGCDEGGPGGGEYQLPPDAVDYQQPASPNYSLAGGDEYTDPPPEATIIAVGTSRAGITGAGGVQQVTPHRLSVSGETRIMAGWGIARARASMYLNNGLSTLAYTSQCIDVGDCTVGDHVDGDCQRWRMFGSVATYHAVNFKTYGNDWQTGTSTHCDPPAGTITSGAPDHTGTPGGGGGTPSCENIWVDVSTDGGVHWETKPATVCYYG